MIAIDLGSNSIRFLQVECATKEILYEHQQVVRTAENLFHTGVISNDATKRIIDAINEVKKEIDFDNDKVKAVTTQAMRVATNAKEILDEIAIKTGVNFTIIDGDMEAELTIDAVANRLNILNVKPKNGFAMIDIGGASTEIAFVTAQERVAKSFPIGIVTLAEEFIDINTLKSNIHSKLKSAKEFVALMDKTIDVLVATAGTPTTVAAMKLGLDYDSYDAKLINGTLLKLAEIDEKLDNLLGMSQEMRVKSVGVGRVDLIATGIVLFAEIMKILEFYECIVVDDGLREGVALEECEEFLNFFCYNQSKL